MKALAIDIVKKFLFINKINVLYILCSVFFWVCILVHITSDVEQFISSWGLDVKGIRLYFGANPVFMWIFCILLYLSSLVIVAINFPFKEHQQRWYILVIFIVSLYIWAYGICWGVIGGSLSILAGLYASFVIFYGRKVYGYERIAKENGRKLEIIKVPVYGSVGNSSKGSNSIKENVENIKKNMENVANDIKNIKRIRPESVGKYKRKRMSEAEISERRKKYSPIFPSNHHIKAGDVAFSGKVYIIKSIWWVPCGYLICIAAIAILGFILGIIGFVIPPSKG